MRKYFEAIANAILGLILVVLSSACSVVDTTENWEVVDKKDGYMIVDISGELKTTGAFSLKEADLKAVIKYYDIIIETVPLTEIKEKTYSRRIKCYDPGDYDFEIEVVVERVEFKNIPIIIIGALIFLASVMRVVCLTIRYRQKKSL